MALVHKKDNPTQGVLAAFFGIDQTTVSRYLQVMDRMLAETLPTAAKISEEIAGAATQEEFKRIVPGQGGGDIFLDGTHCPVQRPSEKTLRRMKYSGKKKRFTNNTNVYTNRDGVIIGISESTVGSCPATSRCSRSAPCRLESGRRRCTMPTGRRGSETASSATAVSKESRTTCRAPPR